MKTRVGPFASGFGWYLCWLGLHKSDVAFGHMVFLDERHLDGYYAETYCERCGLVLKGGPSV